MSDTNTTTVTDAKPEAAGAASTLRPFGLLRVIQTAVGGLLMGIANLIPGVSGGTMILAMGLYQEFIDSVADLTALRLSFRRIAFVVVLGCCAGSAILGLAGAILYLLFHYPAAMFALFIGLTLGGAPLLSRALKPWRADAIVAIVVGFGLMLAVVTVKPDRGFPHNMAMDFVSGVVGSTTMVLPGISGSYMLLVLDQYDRVIGAVHDLKEALSTRNMAALKSAMMIVAPVGVGAILGIVGLSNLLKYLLHRFRRPTVGVLLGVLLGSVIGLWPFGRTPSEKALESRSVTELVEFAKERQVPGAETWTEATAHEAVAEGIRTNWEERGARDYAPSAVLIAVLMAAAGFAGTFALSRLSPDEE